MISCLPKLPGLKRDDAFKHGKPLYWVCNCVDTFASTHENESAVRVGSAGNASKTVKRTKDRSLTDRYKFEAMTIETADSYIEETKT